MGQTGPWPTVLTDNISAAQITHLGSPWQRNTPLWTPPPRRISPVVWWSEVSILLHDFDLARSKLYFSASGRIYHQANIEVVKCIDPRYRLTLAQQIATKFRDPDSRVIVSTELSLLSSPLLTPPMFSSAARLLAVTGARPWPWQTPPPDLPTSHSRAMSSSASSPPSSWASSSSSSVSSYSSSSSAGRTTRKR